MDPSISSTTSEILTTGIPVPDILCPTGSASPAKAIALVACSNALTHDQEPEVDALCTLLRAGGCQVLLSPYIYETAYPNAIYSGTAAEKAGALMDFYQNPEVIAICDISGGDMALELIPYLDFDIIASSDKIFWGYSDLTCLINAIGTASGKKSILYQLRHLNQRDGASGSRLVLWPQSLFQLDYHFLQGNHMEGITVGGNIRCMLKLAGTPYWPSFQDKILVLECMGGKSPLLISYLSQLKLLGVFDQVAGILLGTFTQHDREGDTPNIEDLIRRFAGPDMPIARTNQIGHRRKAHAIVIGEYYRF